MITVLFDGELVSINQRYVSRKFVLSNEYRACKEHLTLAYRLAFKGKLITDPVAVIIKWDKGRKDLDSCVKVILDAMQGEIIKNDSQVKQLLIEDCPGQKTTIKICLYPNF